MSRDWWQQRLCLLAALSCLAPYLALAFFAQPAVDDYCYAVTLRDQGFIGSQRWYYFHWSGRYAATALLQLSERLGALHGAYWAYLVATFVLTIAAVRLLLSRTARALGQPTDGWYVTSLAVALVVLVISRISNPVENFYWLPGVFTYQLGVVGVLTTVAFLLSLNEAPPGQFKVDVAVLGLLGIVTAGLSEIFPVILLPIYGAFAVGAFARRAPSRWVLVALLLIVAVGALVSFLAAGNAVRVASEGVHRRASIVGDIVVTGKWSLRMLLGWIPDIGLLAASLAVVHLVRGLQRERAGFLPWFQRRHAVVRVLCLAGLVGGVVFLTGFPNVYGLAVKAPTQHRVINTAYMLFLLAWLVAVVMGANGFLRWRGIDRPMIGVVSLALLLLSSVWSANFRESVRELRNLPRFLGEIRARHHAVADVSAGDDVVIEPLRAPHLYLFMRDITDDDVAHWSNACYAAYLGVATIRLRTDN